MIILKVYGKGEEITDIQIIPIDPVYTEREINYFCKKHTSQSLEKYWEYAFVIKENKEYNLDLIYEMFREQLIH